MGRGTKTTEFLKECLSDALIRLMRDKPFDKITIDEMAQEAGVNRSTWFRNYKSKNEVLTFKFVQAWHRWADEHAIAVRSRFTLDNAEDFFQFNYEIRHVLQVVYAAEMQSAVYDAFYQVMMPQYGANAKECYQARFYSYGLFGLLDEWVRRGFKESVEEMTRIFHQIIAEGNISPETDSGSRHNFKEYIIDG